MRIIQVFAIAVLTSWASAHELRAADRCDQTDTFDRYACLINAAARGAAGLKYYDIEAYQAIATAQTVQAIASSARASYWHNDLKYPAMDKQEICLEQGFGICGNHQQLFIELMRRMDVAVRPVSFYYFNGAGRATHAAAEFLLNGKWRFVDVTWASVWLDDRSDLGSMLSLEEIDQGKGVRLTSELDPWYVAMRSAGADPFDYLGPDVDVIEGGEGSVTVPIAARGAVQTADFSNTPNYIGDYEADGEHRRLSLKLSLGQPALLAVNVASLAGSCDHSRIAIGSFEAPVAVGTLYVAVPAAATIEIRGEDDLCYAVLGGITVHPPQSAIAPSQLPGAPG